MISAIRISDISKSTNLLISENQNDFRISDIADLVDFPISVNETDFRITVIRCTATSGNLRRCIPQLRRAKLRLGYEAFTNDPRT